MNVYELYIVLQQYGGVYGAYGVAFVLTLLYIFSLIGGTDNSSTVTTFLFYDLLEFVGGGYATFYFFDDMKNWYEVGQYPYVEPVPEEKKDPYEPDYTDDSPFVEFEFEL